MSDERIEIVDRDLSSPKGVKKSRQIRTRKTSHDKFISLYDRERIRLLKQELDAQKKLAVSEVYEGSKEMVEAKADKRARKIATIEEKIKVLSREAVPTNYVDDRAIKLKESMMSHLRNYTGLMYSIGSGKESEVFDSVAEPTGIEVVDQIATEASEEIGGSPATDTPVVDENANGIDNGATEEIVIDPANADPKEIKAKVEEGFKKAGETVISTEDTISAEDIKKVIDGRFVNVEDYVDSSDVKGVIDGAFERLQSDKKVNDAIGQSNGAVAVDDFVMPYDDEISTIVDDDLMDYDDSISTVYDENGEPVIPYDDSVSQVYDETKPGSRIEGEIKKAVKNYYNPPKDKAVLTNDEDSDLKDVIREEVRSALEHYDSELKKTVRDPRYSYKPMTDEEIAASREKLGAQFNTPTITSVFEPVSKVKNASSNNVSVDGPAIRDEIVVVPERDGSPAVKENAQVEEYQFTSGEAQEDVPQLIGKYDGRSFNSQKRLEIKRRIAELKKARELARKDAIAAELRLQEVDEQSRMAKQKYEETGARLEQIYDAYAEELAASINSFDNKAKFARDAIDMEQRFIDAQNAQTSELEDEIAVVSGYARH